MPGRFPGPSSSLEGVCRHCGNTGSHHIFPQRPFIMYPNPLTQAWTPPIRRLSRLQLRPWCLLLACWKCFSQMSLGFFFICFSQICQPLHTPQYPSPQHFLSLPLCLSPQQFSESDMLHVLCAGLSDHPLLHQQTLHTNSSRVGTGLLGSLLQMHSEGGTGEWNRWQ